MTYRIRELDLGGVLDDAILLTKNHFRQFVFIAGITMIPFLLAQGGVLLSQMPEVPANPTQVDLEEYQKRVVGLLPLIVFVLALEEVVFLPLATAPLIRAMAGAYLGRPISTGQAFRWVLRRFFPIAAMWLLFSVIYWGGSAMCLVPGIIAGLLFALALPVAVVESAGPATALLRSANLVSGNLGMLFVLKIMLLAIKFWVRMTGAFIPQEHVQLVATAVINTGLVVLDTAATVVYYVSCRCKHEQFDLQRLAQAVGEQTPVETAQDDGSVPGDATRL